MTSMIYSSNEADHFSFSGNSISEGGYAWSVHFPEGSRIVGETVTLPDDTQMRPSDAFVAAVSRSNGLRVINSRTLGASDR